MKRSYHVEESKEVSQEVALLDSVIFGTSKISHISYSVCFMMGARAAMSILAVFVECSS